MVTADHGFYEWAFLLYHAQYVFAISLGIFAGIIRHLRLEKSYRAMGMAIMRERARQKDASGKPPLLAPEPANA